MNALKIGIAGGGIMGRLLAWQLIGRGHRITLFDQDPIANGTAASYTAAGMLTPWSELDSAEILISLLGRRSLNLWPEIIQSLGADVGFRQNGSLILAHPGDLSELHRFSAKVQSKLPTNELLSIVTRQQIALLEPELADQFEQALHFPDEASLCPRCVMSALADALLAAGVAWYANSQVLDLDAKSIQLKGQRHHFDRVVDCRGLGARAQLQELRSVRGELILLQAPQVKINRLIRIMHPRYSLYLVPKKDDLYVIGATQIESNDRSEITLRSSLELLSAAYAIHPGFAEAKVLESKTNCRPAMNDNQPWLDSRKGLTEINGLYRHGFLLAPALAELAIQKIEAPIERAAFEPDWKQQIMMS